MLSITKAHRALCAVWRCAADALSRSLRSLWACKSFPGWRSGRAGGDGQDAETALRCPTARGPRPPPPLPAHLGAGSPWKQPLEPTPGPQLSPWQLLPPALSAKLRQGGLLKLCETRRCLPACDWSKDHAAVWCHSRRQKKKKIASRCKYDA